MKFRVRALAADNSITQLMLEALDVQDARQQAESRLFKVVEISAGLENPFRRLFTRRKLSLLLFSQELLALLRAGLGLVEALDALAEREGAGTQRAIIARISATLREGKRFSAALAEQNDVFTPLYIGLIRSAEDTNNLPEALSRFIDYQRKVDSVKSKIINASIYPTILFIVGSGVTLFLITFVVPRFAVVYRDSGRTLPWLSQLLLDWGRYASAQPLMLGLQLAIGLAGIAILLRHLVKAGHLSRVSRLLPWIGRNLRIYELSRLYLTLGMLLKGGIPVASALGIVRPVLSPAMATSVTSAEEHIRAGASFSDAFETAGLTTVISRRMLRVGERAGQLPEMLAQAAQFYDGDIERFLERFTRAFEPLLMAVIGAVVGLIVILLYMPIFDLAGGLS